MTTLQPLEKFLDNMEDKKPETTVEVVAKEEKPVEEPKKAEEKVAEFTSEVIVDEVKQN